MVGERTNYGLGMIDAKLKRFPIKPSLQSIVGLLIALCQSGLGEPQKSTIHFTNGDWLRGNLKTFDQATGISWEHPDAGELMQFNINRITEVTLDSQSPIKLTPGNLCEVQLINGDHFRGNLAGITEKAFQLNTWHSGSINVDRRTVRKIAPLAKGLKTIFQGPVSDSEWTHGKIANEILGQSGKWRYHNGGFHAKPAASIARNLNLPDRSRLSFDLEWSGSLHLAFALYTDTLHPISLSTKENEPDFGGFYSIQLNSYSVNLLPVKKNEPLTYLGQATLPGFRNESKSHVEFFASKPEKMIAVSINGKVIRKWTDSDGFVGEGSGIRIVHQGRGAVRIANLRVEEWDGRFQEPPTHPIGSENDLVKLINSDRMEGTVTGISDGKLQVKTPEGEFPVPLDRVKQIEPATIKTSLNMPLKKRVIAHLSDGSRLTFVLERWAKTGVEVSSPSFGKATFQPEAIMRMEFQAHFAQADVKTVYRVKKGDTLNSIARKNNSSVKAILRANPPLPPPPSSRVKVGQQLIIPKNP
jgi:hypothetical protein